MKHSAAFSLIELLMVISIISILAAMLFPMLSVVRRQAATVSTQSLLKRVDNALQRFQAEAGCFPYQDHALGYPQPNRLAWHLRHAMTTAEVATLRSDANTASNCYDLSASGSTMVITPAQVDPRELQSDPKLIQAAIANRSARQRARLAILAGYTTVKGLKFTGYDFSGTLLAPAASSQGIALDLLSADLESREVSGTAIIDRWKQPLIYVCPVISGTRAMWMPGAVGTNGVSAQRATIPFTPAYYGLQSQGRTVTTSLSDSILTSAAEPYCFTYELWSSGPNRKTNTARNHPDTQDDISAAPYRKGLQ